MYLWMVSSSQLWQTAGYHIPKQLCSQLPCTIYQVLPVNKCTRSTAIELEPITVLTVDHICSSVKTGNGPSVSVISVNGVLSPLMMTRSYQRWWLLYILNLISTQMQSVTLVITVGLDYQLTTTACCRKQGTFQSSWFVTIGPCIDSADPSRRHKIDELIWTVICGSF